MSESTSVSALRVADEAFLVASTIERCPKTMMLRELVVNAIEAAGRSKGFKIVEITCRQVGGARKLCILNTGPGLSADELYRICDLASSVGKINSLDDNFGMGAKVASLPSNKQGLRYRSSKAGVVSEVVLGQRNGIYGRLRRPGPNGEQTEVLDVTQACIAEGGYDLRADWTEVVLYGNSLDQDTVADPYDNNPKMAPDWIPQSLLLRFFELPGDVLVECAPEILGGGPARRIQTFTDLRPAFTRSETVRSASGIMIHYFYDAPVGASPAPVQPGSFAGLVFRGEIYDVRSGVRWSLDAPSYGIPFGSKYVTVFVELPDDYLARPEAYRQFLRFRGGDQRQVFVAEYAKLVRAYMPAWLAKIIRSFGPDQADFLENVNDELRALLEELGVAPNYMPPEALQKPMPPVPQHATQPVVHTSGAETKPPPPKSRFERPPEIIGLSDDDMIAERGLVGRAGRFYESSHQLFLNLRYESVGHFAAQLEASHQAETGEAVSNEQRRTVATQVAHWAITRHIARALVFSFTKKSSGWGTDDVQRAQSPEALSLLADDWSLLLQPAIKRMHEQIDVAEADGQAMAAA